MPDVVSVRYVGKNMAPLGGTMIQSGETRHKVPRYQVREALRYNPGKFVILDDLVAKPAESDAPAVVRGHSHDHVEVTTSAEPGEFLIVQAEPPSDEPVTVLSEVEHVDQPEQPGKSPAKRRARKK